MTIQKNEKIGNIVTRFPKASQIFNQFEIDYCCGGDRLLETVCDEKNIKPDTIIELLVNLHKKTIEKHIDWTIAPLDDLIDHIMQAHHAYLNINLPIIGEHIKKIVRVHGVNHPELVKVYQLFNTLKSEMELHLIKEETLQYPAIEKYLDTHKIKDLDNAINIIDELENDHEDVGNILKELRKITNGFKTPSDACQTYQNTFNYLLELEQNTFTHVHLENNVLFPRLKKILKGWNI